jgi:hypothetical protein
MSKSSSDYDRLLLYYFNDILFELISFNHMKENSCRPSKNKDDIYNTNFITERGCRYSSKSRSNGSTVLSNIDALSDHRFSNLH